MDGFLANKGLRSVSVWQNSSLRMITRFPATEQMTGALTAQDLEKTERWKEGTGKRKMVYRGHKFKFHHYPIGQIPSYYGQ